MIDLQSRISLLFIVIERLMFVDKIWFLFFKINYTMKRSHTMNKITNNKKNILNLTLKIYWIIHFFQLKIIHNTWYLNLYSSIFNQRYNMKYEKIIFFVYINY